MLRLLTGRLDLNNSPFFMRLYQGSEETPEDEPQNRIERGKLLIQESSYFCYDN